MFEPLYDVSEQARVQFIGCVTERGRYDFSIVFTRQFLGKSMVVCMQSGRSSLLSEDDLNEVELLQSTFAIEDRLAAEELVLLLRSRIPRLDVSDQY